MAILRVFSRGGEVDGRFEPVFVGIGADRDGCFCVPDASAGCGFLGTASGLA